MAADAEPLQGSLFGNAIDISTDYESPKEVPLRSNEDLSDQQLAKDAQARPRKRNKQEFDQDDAALSSKKSHSNSAEEKPSWSHHRLVEPQQLTPVLRHYVELKAANPERILLYRLGDFFECFFEDAIQLSRLLELTLTGKEAGKEIGRIPMAGIPHHSVERYCSELIRRGLSVALCDQLESTPSKGSLLKRDITRVFTPGTVIEEGMLNARRNNWLAAVVFETANGNKPFRWGLATADVSTGEFLVTQREGSSMLHQELIKLDASELLWGQSSSIAPKDWCPERLKLTPIESTPFSEPEAELVLKNQYKLGTVNGLGLKEMPLALRAAGGLLAYLRDTNPIMNCEINNDSSNSIPISLERPRCTFAGDSLILDAQTRRNLELTSTQREGQFHGSLLWAVDRTLTAMGGRCLRRWIEAPLIEKCAITARQAVVSILVKDRPLRNTIRGLLRAMGDLERLAGRAGAGQASARDLVAIASGLERLPRLAKELHDFSKSAPDWMADLIHLDPCLIEIATIIRHQLLVNPPLSLNEGGLIHDGVDPILDGLRNQLDDQETWLTNQETLERKASGNANLRLQFHRTFGYFLSVSKARAGNVPDHWIRRQTLSNEERFITPTLKAREGKIVQSKARAAEREYGLFCKLRQLVGEYVGPIRKAARAVAGLDALAGLADVAATNGYCEPEIIDQEEEQAIRALHIQGSRHPVVEQLMVEETFKPNDIHLGEGTDLIVLTGPNASGKSCYLRQIGLVQLLAQIGGWVPAQKARLSISDRIFTRVGAVDDLATGQSTFMVEMAETAYILNNATDRSLVLLDEIGRGTATFDGLSIAIAVTEFLAKNLRSRTVFATHYHELNALSKSLANVANFQVLVEETGEDLVFLHRVAPGGASRSYGIEAARLAGVPNYVVKRARVVLEELQQQSR